MVRRLDHEKAIALRMTGKSYNEIAKDLGVCKSCLSYWLKNLNLPTEAIKILERKKSNASDKLAECNRKKHERVQADNKEIKETFSKKVGLITDRELFLIGAALYWGEGYKNFNKGSHYISFVNSDPDMVKIFLLFVRKILKVSEDKLKPSIHIYPSISKDSAISFWAEITNIPKYKFHTYNQISRASKGKKPKNLLPYGTLDLRIISRQKFFEIMGLIDGIIKQAA